MSAAFSQSLALSSSSSSATAALSRHSRPWSLSERTRSTSSSSKKSSKLSKNGCLPGCTNYPRCACRRKNALKEKIKSKFDLSVFLSLSKESEQLSSIRLLADLVEDGKIALNECVEKKTLEKLTDFLTIPGLQHAALETLGVLLYVWLRVTKAANKKSAKAHHSHAQHKHDHSGGTEGGCSMCPTCRSSNTAPLPSNYTLPAQSLDDWLCTSTASSLISATLPLLKFAHTRHMASYVLLHFCDGAKTATTLINTPNAIDTLLEVYSSLIDTKDNSMLLELSSIITGICIKPTKETLPKLTPIAPVLLIRFRNNSNSLLTAYICKALGRLCDGQKEIAELVLAANITSYLLFLYYTAVEREKSKKKNDMEGVLFEDVFGLLGLLAFYEKPQQQKLLSPLPQPQSIFTLPEKFTHINSKLSLITSGDSKSENESVYQQQETSLSNFIRHGQPKLDLVDIISIVFDLVSTLAPTSSDWYYVQCAAWQINMILTNGLAVRDSVFRRQRLIASAVFSKMLRMMDDKVDVMPNACLCSLAQALSYSVLGASSSQIGYLVMQGMLGTMMVVMKHSKTTRKLLLCVLHALHAILAMGERDRWRYSRKRMARTLHSAQSNNGMLGIDDLDDADAHDDSAVFDSSAEGEDDYIDDVDEADNEYDAHNHHISSVTNGEVTASYDADYDDSMDDASDGGDYDSDASSDDYIVQDSEKRRKGEIDEPAQRRGNKRRFKKRNEPNTHNHQNMHTQSHTQSHTHAHSEDCPSHSSSASTPAPSMCHGCQSCALCPLPPMLPFPAPIRPPQNSYVNVLRRLDAESQLVRIEAQLGSKQSKEDQALLTLMRKVNAYFKHTPNIDTDNPFIHPQPSFLDSKKDEIVTDSSVKGPYQWDYGNHQLNPSSPSYFVRPVLSVSEKRRRRQRAQALKAAAKAAFVSRRRELRFLLTGMRGELPLGLASNPLQPRTVSPTPSTSVKPSQPPTTAIATVAPPPAPKNSTTAKSQDKASIDEILRLVQERERTLSAMQGNTKSVIAALEEKQKLLKEKKEKKERELKRAQQQLAQAVEQANNSKRGSAPASAALSDALAATELFIAAAVESDGSDDESVADTAPESKKDKKKKAKKVKAKQKKDKNRAAKAKSTDENSESKSEAPVGAEPAAEDIDPVIEAMREQRRAEQAELDRKRQELGLYTRQQAERELELARERLKEEAKQRELEKQQRKIRQKEEEKLRAELREKQAALERVEREKREKERKEREEKERAERAKRLEHEAETERVAVEKAKAEAEARAAFPPLATCRYADCPLSHRIHNDELYVLLKCSKNCKLYYHHPQCWNQVRLVSTKDSPLMRDALKPGMVCPSADCAGTVSAAKVKKGKDSVIETLLSPATQSAPAAAIKSPAVKTDAKKKNPPSASKPRTTTEYKAAIPASTAEEERKEQDFDAISVTVTEPKKSSLGFEVVVHATQKDFVPVIPNKNSFHDEVKEKVATMANSHSQASTTAASHSHNHAASSQSQAHHQRAENGRAKGRAGRRTRIDLASFLASKRTQEEAESDTSHPVQFTRTAYGGLVRTHRDGSASRLLYVRAFPESLLSAEEDAVNEWIVRACAYYAPIYVTRFYAPSALLLEFPSLNEALTAFHSLNRRFSIQFATEPPHILPREELSAATNYAEVHMQLARKGQTVEQLTQLSQNASMTVNEEEQQFADNQALLLPFDATYETSTPAAVLAASASDEEELNDERFDFSFLAIGHEEDNDNESTTVRQLSHNSEDSSIIPASMSVTPTSPSEPPKSFESESWTAASVSSAWSSPVTETRPLLSSLQSVFTPLSIAPITATPKLKPASIASLTPALDPVHPGNTSSGTSVMGSPPSEPIKPSASLFSASVGFLSFSIFQSSSSGFDSNSTIASDTASVSPPASGSSALPSFFSSITSASDHSLAKSSLLRLDDDDELVWNEQKLSSLRIKSDVDDDDSLSGILTHPRHDSIAGDSECGVDRESEASTEREFRASDLIQDDDDSVNDFTQNSFPYSDQQSQQSLSSAPVTSSISPPGFPSNPAYQSSARPTPSGLNATGDHYDSMNGYHGAPNNVSGPYWTPPQSQSHSAHFYHPHAAHPSMQSQPFYYASPYAANPHYAAQAHTHALHAGPIRAGQLPFVTVSGYHRPHPSLHQHQQARAALSAAYNKSASVPYANANTAHASAHAFLALKSNDGSSGAAASGAESSAMESTRRVRREFVVDLEADFPSLNSGGGGGGGSTVQQQPEERAEFNPPQTSTSTHAALATSAASVADEPETRQPTTTTTATAIASPAAASSNPSGSPAAAAAAPSPSASPSVSQSSWASPIVSKLKTTAQSQTLARTPATPATAKSAMSEAVRRPSVSSASGVGSDWTQVASGGRRNRTTANK